MKGHLFRSEVESVCVCICTCMYECMCVCICVYYAYIHECVYISKASRFYVLLFRAKKELGFLVALQFSFVITGREREGSSQSQTHLSSSLFSEAATRIDL